MLKIEGKKTYLLEFTEENLHNPRYFEWLRDLDVATGIYRLDYLLPHGEKEIEKYVRGLFASKNDYFFALHHGESREFIGTVKLGHIDWRTHQGDVGIMIGEKNYWGQGLAKDAVSALCKYAFSTLSMRKLTGGTAANNIGMVKCFRDLGFKDEGNFRKRLLINGEYIDHLHFGLFKEEFREK